MDADKRFDIKAKRDFGAHSAGEIPVPIPNTEVKPSRGDYTATSGKLARCQIIRVSHPDGWLFVYLEIDPEVSR